MELMKEMAERLEGKGWLGLGLGALLVAPVLLPKVGPRIRPIAKRGIKGYLSLADRTRGLLAETRERLAETRERLDNLVAEARAEHEQREELTPVASAAAEDETGANPEAATGERQTRAGKTRQAA